MVKVRTSINKKQGTIGIPKGLLYYKYFPLWKTFFEKLDYRVVESEKTNTGTLKEGSRYAIDEICIPLKVYYGHVVNLTGKEIDYLFVPRYISTTFGTYMCPKFLGLPDLIRGTINNLPPIIELEIDLRKKPIFYSMLETGRKLNGSFSQIKSAFEESVKTYQRFRVIMEAGFTFQEAFDLLAKNPAEIPERRPTGNPAKVAVVGHGYNVHDPFVNMGLLKKLENMKVDAVVLENLPGQIFKQKTKISETLKNYWGNEEEILSGVDYLFKNNLVDGVIFLCSFCCGPDSLIDEIITRDAKTRDIPYICVVMDEHSGQAGVITRVETFVDMILRRKRSRGTQEAG